MKQKRKLETIESRNKRQEYLDSIGYHDRGVRRQISTDLMSMLQDLENADISTGFVSRTLSAGKHEYSLEVLHELAKQNMSIYKKWLPRMQELNAFFLQHPFATRSWGYPLDFISDE